MVGFYLFTFQGGMFRPQRLFDARQPTERNFFPGKTWPEEKIFERKQKKFSEQQLFFVRFEKLKAREKYREGTTTTTMTTRTVTTTAIETNTTATTMTTTNTTTETTTTATTTTAAKETTVATTTES